MPAFPRNRLIREGEVRMCRVCQSGRYAHRRGGDRSDHPFDPAPNWWTHLKRFVRGHVPPDGGGQ